MFFFKYKVDTRFIENSACVPKHVGVETAWLCVINLVHFLDLIKKSFRKMQGMGHLSINWWYVESPVMVKWKETVGFFFIYTWTNAIIKYI